MLTESFTQTFIQRLTTLVTGLLAKRVFIGNVSSDGSSTDRATVCVSVSYSIYLVEWRANLSIRLRLFPQTFSLKFLQMIARSFPPMGTLIQPWRKCLP